MGILPGSNATVGIALGVISACKSLHHDKVKTSWRILKLKPYKIPELDARENFLFTWTGVFTKLPVLQ